MSLSAQALPTSPTLTLAVSEPDRTLKKSADLFAERGFAQVGMRELARHLGISSGSIYHHIESKQALLGELIEDLYQTLLAGNPQASRLRKTAQEELRDIIDWHLLVHAMKTKQFLLAERDVHYLDEQYRAPIESLRREYQKRLASRIAAARGCPPSPLIQKLCASLVSVLNNLPAWLPADMEHSRQSLGGGKN